MQESIYEALRLAALKRLKLLDTPPEARFERLTKLAQRFYGVKTALFSLVDEDRQFFKSRQGLGVCETSRSVAFCDHAIRNNGLFIVPDALEDPRFCNNPLVTGEPHIRFYAGMPVRERSGFNIGTLCIIDNQPRHYSDIELDVLRLLASIIEDELDRSYDSGVESSLIDISHMHRAISRAQHAFIVSNDEQATFQILLNDLLTLTGSEFGIVGEVYKTSEGAPYLKVGAITNIAWNEEMQAFYRQIQGRGMIFDRLDNLLGHAIRTGELTIANDVPGDPRGAGLPKGHPAIHHYLGIPILILGEVTGLVALANRQEGYSAELATELSPLLLTISSLLSRKRMYDTTLEQSRRMARKAHTDELTGLPNRGGLKALFQEMVERPHGTPVAVGFLDLDGFKHINDTRGHEAGDALLRATAGRLKSCVRRHDIVARLAGDEFVLVFSDGVTPDTCERIIRQVRQEVMYGDTTLQVSCSLGIAQFPHDGTTLEDVLKCADSAMYDAKRAGKNGFALYDSAADRP